MGSGKGKSKRARTSASHAGAEIIGESDFVTNYKYVVVVPREATLEEIESVVEMLRGLGGAELNVEKRIITGDFDVESQDAFGAGYDLRVFEEEINTELSSRGWEQIERPRPGYDPRTTQSSATAN